MEERPLVSVVIPTYNRAEYICDAVDSVLEQTYKNIEIIVVDDGSKDNTRDVLSKYGARIKYIYQDNAGPSGARNNGIRNSRGEFLAFLDSDDIWLPEKLEKQMKLIESSQDIGLVSCGLYNIDASGGIMGEPTIKKNYVSSEKLLRDLLIHNIVGGGSVPLIRRECFHKLGLFSEDIWVCEDRDMWIRIARNYEIKFVEEPLFKYRIHGTNLNKDVTKIEENTKKLIERNIEKGKFLLKRKAYSHMYVTLAWEFIDAGNRNLAAANILKSIMKYPLKNYDEDGKHKMLIRLMLPDRLFQLLVKLRKRTNN